VRDIASIVLMVAGYLLRSGMNPQGLWRSLTRPPCIVDAPIPARVADAFPKETSHTIIE